MKTQSILMLAAVTVALASVPALAQKGPKFGGTFGSLFAPEVYSVEPGIEAILLLTDEQRTKIAEALTTTIQSPALAELGSKLKKGNADSQEAFARYQVERVKAQEEYKKRVEAILTAEQKATIKKIDDTVKGAVESVLTTEQKEALAKTRKTKK